MTWLLKWTLKLCGGNKWIAYAILAAVVAAIGVTLYASGYLRGYSAADQKALVASLKKDKQQLQSDLKEAGTTITQRDQVIEQMETLKNENAELTQRLKAAEGKQRIVYRNLRSEAVALTAERAVETDAGPQCVFDARFVRVWNDALEGTLTTGMPDTASGTADTAAGPVAAATDITVGDLLTNHIDNRELDSAIRSQCSALIEWHRQHDQ